MFRIRQALWVFFEIRRGSSAANIFYTEHVAPMSTDLYKVAVKQMAFEIAIEQLSE